MNTKHTACYVVLLTIMLCISAAATACPPPPPPPPPPYVTICGDINTSTTWTADKTYYVSCIIYVRNNATLTIEPGTVVKFNAATGISTLPDGVLIAEGTPQSYITLTSKYDCNVGEIVDSSRQPQKLDWGGLQIKKNSKVSFCKISYGYSSVILMDLPFPPDITSASIEHNIIRMCNTGIYVIGIFGTDTTLNIFNNLVSNCDLGGIWFQSFNETVNLNIVNNTVVDCANVGLYVHSESEATYVYNNLISGCGIGIEGGGWADPRCSYNAFYNTTTEFMYVDEGRQGTTTNVHPADSPFDTCVLGPYFLNDASNGGNLLINAGNPSSQSMLGYTTQCLKLSDEDIVDIGFHYPSDYEGKGRDIFCDGTPFPVDSIISAGGDHSLFIKADINKTVWACGHNDDGAAGLGEAKKYIYTYTPEQVLQGNKNYPVNDGNLEGIASVDAGHSHSLAVDTDGNVWAWGDNSQGELGTGNINAQPVWAPVQVKNGSGNGFLLNIKKVSAGSGYSCHSLALGKNGKVWAWGNNSYSVGDSDDRCGLEGDYLYGLLGTGSVAEYNSTPAMVLNIENIVDIAHSVSHVIACDTNGNVWTWGYNEHGELGYSEDDDCAHWYTTYPVKVLHGQMNNTQSQYLENIVDVAASGLNEYVDMGGNTSYALDSNGHVWSWGSGKLGQLGDNNECRRFDEEPCQGVWKSNTPIQVKGGEMGTDYLEHIVAISAGSYHILALDEFGRVWAWGVNLWSSEFGRAGGLVGNGGDCDCVISPCDGYCYDVGYGDPFYGVMTPDIVHKCHYDENAYPNHLVDDGPLTDIVAIEAGGEHSMAIDRSGRVWGWGNNINGQLGFWGDYSAYPMAIQINTWEFCP